MRGRNGWSPRWLDARIVLHHVQTWLGHAKVSQTSTYLQVTDQGQHEAMRKFDDFRCKLVAEEEEGKWRALHDSNVRPPGS